MKVHLNKKINKPNRWPPDKKNGKKINMKIEIKKQITQIEKVELHLPLFLKRIDGEMMVAIFSEKKIIRIISYPNINTYNVAILEKVEPVWFDEGCTGYDKMNISTMAEFIKFETKCYKALQAIRNEIEDCVNAGFGCIDETEKEESQYVGIEYNPITETMDGQ